MKNPLLSEFEQMLLEEDSSELEAMKLIHDIMQEHEAEFAVDLLIALKDWLDEEHEDANMGRLIFKEIILDGAAH